ncbi:MAG TPA: polymer-forming cytoskeletal protein [Terriglobia bacterium]|nr:polymer-forming cytoskeletal protein [Terriglobia bacterium]
MTLFRRKPSEEEISGFLDQGTHVTGELQFSGTLRLDGTFHGSISSADVLIVGEHAVVHADIVVGAIEIHGRVFGNVEAKRQIEIFSTGHVHGDVRTPTLVVQTGAVFDGRSIMSAEGNDSRGLSSDDQASRQPGMVEADGA